MSDIAALVAEIQALYEKATPGDWMVYDSCSWRRIGIKGDYKTIIQPYVASDRHPDLCGINLQDDLALLITLKNAWPRLREMAEDAERYRWLRKHVTFCEQETLSPLKVYYRRWYHDTTYRPESGTAAGMFDAAIDAARKEAGRG